MLPRTPRSLLFGVCLAACTGTDTGNPPLVTDFTNTGCKSSMSGALTQKGVKGDLAWSEDDAAYQGLHCFLWERLDERTLRIDLTNYESGCHTDKGWVPRAEVRDDGTLELVLDDHDCSAASCGWCIYDLSFTVELDDSTVDRQVRLSQAGCGEENRLGRSASLPLSSQDRGAVCGYAHYYALQQALLSTGAAPTAHFPCGEVPGLDPQASECQEGLSCTDVGEQAPSVFAGGPRCIPVCETDADCDALGRCEDGTCRLRGPGIERF